MLRPLDTSQASAQGILNLPVCTLNHAIRLGVVYCCSDVFNPQPLAEAAPYG